MTRSRSTGIVLLRIGALAATLVVLAAAPASAAVIASSESGFEGGPALARDGRVVIGERRQGDGAPRGSGARRVLGIDPRTHAFRELAAFSAPSGQRSGDARRVLSLAGTGGIVTASLDTILELGGSEPGQGFTSAATTTTTVLPTLTALTSCGPFGAPPQLDAAGGEDFVATLGDECGAEAPTVRLRSAHGTIAIAAVSGPADTFRTPDVVALHATGPMVAWVEVRRPVGAPIAPTLVVARGATGEILLRTALDGLPAQLGLAADGTVVLSLRSDVSCSLRAVSPAAPTVRRLRLPVAGGLCPSPTVAPRGQGTIAVVGGRIVYRAVSGYGVTDLWGATHALGEVGERPTIAGAIAFDGRTVFAVRSGCDGDRLLALDADVAAGGTPPSPLRTKAPCVIQRSGPATLRVARDGHVSVGLRCESGCLGTLRLVQQRSGHRERLVAGAGFARSGRGVVVRRLRIARYARALAGCRGGLRVQAVLWPFAEHSRGLGSYRVLSRARCHRGGGPAFAAAHEPQP
jgi:hypothetical protein